MPSDEQSENQVVREAHNVPIKMIERVIDLLIESLAPKVVFTNDLNEMRMAAVLRQRELINTAITLLYDNVGGLQVRDLAKIRMPK